MNPFTLDFCGFRVGSAVIHKGIRGHVIAVPLEWVPSGEVPVMWYDEANCFDLIPADDLKIPQVVSAITAS